MSLGALGIPAKVGKRASAPVIRATSAATAELGSIRASLVGVVTQADSRTPPARMANGVVTGKKRRDVFICAKVICDDDRTRKGASKIRAVLEDDG